jgi:hypothetical protein
MEKIEITEFDTSKTRTYLLNFIIQMVKTFLQQHPNEVFNAFAFGCNSEYGDINRGGF